TLFLLYSSDFRSVFIYLHSSVRVIPTYSRNYIEPIPIIMKKLILSAILLSVFSCSKENQQVDILVINANVYTVNSNFDKAEAFAIKDGKFFQVGTSKDLQNTFEADTIIDAKGQAVFPGFIDAHCHFY